MKNVKSIIITLIMHLMTSVVFSQTINNVPIENINVEYILIVGTTKFFSNDVTIQIDFGQKNKIFSTKDSKILDIDGKEVIFHSMVDALNFMSENGYCFITAYVITVGNQNVYYYLLRKEWYIFFKEFR